METFRANHCPLIATVVLTLVALPLAGRAQEPGLDDASSAPPVPQRRFVSDKLVLNVYAEPDPGSARVATIQTGDVVDELERSGHLVHVRLADGQEGWVGANYLTSDVPAAARLRELQQEQKNATPRTTEKELAAEIALLKKEHATLQKENTTLRAQIGELQSKAVAPAESADSGPISVAEAADVVSSEHVAVGPTSGQPIGWLIAVLLTGALGFAAGYQTLARRLRKKFGGLKIY